MYTYLLTIVRHGAGIAAGYVLTLVAGLLGLEVTADITAATTEVFTWLGVGIFAFGWTLVEKALKPIFANLGEKPESPIQSAYTVPRR